MALPIPYTGATEGAVDEVVLRAVVDAAGRQIHQIYNTRGKGNLTRRLPGFNQAANHAPWIVLIDLDQTACAPELIQEVAPAVAPQMRLRVAVRAVESWILGDSDRLSSFLGVPPAHFPANPDDLGNPKTALVDLARRSRRRAIREDMVPRPGAGRSVGPAYEARLIEFVTRPADGWRAIVAAQRSPSLDRCLRAIA